jgi:hypothetical protein
MRPTTFVEIQMSYIHPAAAEHRRKRFTRPDAWRLAPPGTPEARPPGYLHPSARIARAEEAKAAADEAEREAKADTAFLADLESLRADHERLRIELADVKFALALRRIFHKYSPDQPRVPAGSSEGGQWTSGGNGSANDSQLIEQDRDGLATAPDQQPRDDLQRLQAIANDPAIRSRINEAWNASNPPGRQPQEHGFWIARNESTGELFTRPFANPGSMRQITPGPTPDDAIAFFHTHPNTVDRSGVRSTPGPSRSDQLFAAGAGLPGIIQSHNGIYYFGPALRPSRGR